MYRKWLASTLILSLSLMAVPTISVAAGQTPATKKPDAAPPPPPAPGKADAAAKQSAAKGVRTVEMIGTEDMKYSVTTITAKPGEQIRVRLTAKGAMPKIAMAHNFVLLAKAADVLKFVNASAMAATTGYIPADLKDQVLASTALAGAGETVEVTFKAPTAAGAYPFVCSFPGHFAAGMKGTLTVK